MSSFEFYFDDDEPAYTKNMLVIYRNIRERANPFDIPENEFVKNFRLSKTAFMFLLNKYESNSKRCIGSNSLSPVTKLLSVLKFFAVGAYQKCVGNDYLIGMHQTTFSKILMEMLDFFEKTINKEFIKFETSEESLRKIKQGFYESYSFPGVIGVVDGTHIKILPPAKSIRHLYYNRKGYYSINVMLVCDDSMRITYVDARHAGASHDSFIWNSSGLETYLLSLYRTTNRNSWILGDCGYPLKPYLITPYKNLINNAPSYREKLAFNELHSKCRNIIERVNGVLKNRFRAIIGARQLHYHPDKVAKIINAACSLHNMCIKYNVPEPEEISYNTTDHSTDDVEDSELELENNVVAEEIRNRIMRSFN